jgi:membrane associated rhomboid family serine protease
MPLHLHIVMNGIGLYFLGSGIEALLGPRRLFVIYALSCLGGSVASTDYGPGSARTRDERSTSAWMGS